MILKFMGKENMPDDSVSKPCRIIDCVVDVRYFKNFEGHMAIDYVQEQCGKRVDVRVVLQGNVYLMNDAGKTIQSFSAIVGQELPVE